MLGLSGGPGGGVVTVWDLLAVAARRWVVLVVGALVTAGLVLQVWTIPGVYHQEVNVLFLMPDRPQDTNRLTSVSDSLISFAGVVERVMNADARGSRVVSEEVNLATTGVRAGYSVRLPNAGGQWANNFNRPVLKIQATGPTPEAVRATVADVVSRINGEIDRLQDEAGVTAENRVATRLSPVQPNMSFSKGSRPRAAAMTVLIGIGVTLGAAVLLDGPLARLAERRRRRRTVEAAGAAGGVVPEQRPDDVPPQVPSPGFPAYH
jgi:hypothetical protein